MISKTVVAPDCLPSFELLHNSGNDESVLESQWEFICSKIGRGSISFVLPKTTFAPQVSESQAPEATPETPKDASDQETEEPSPNDAAPTGAPDSPSDQTNEPAPKDNSAEEDTQNSSD